MDNDTLAARNGSSGADGGSFEASLERLHEIVSELEAGELTLDDTIARFQEGSALSQRCLQMIDAAELKVSEIAPAIASPDHG